MVPSDVQTLVAKAYRQECWNTDRWSQSFELAMAWALREILSVQLTGTRIPRDGSFDW